MQLETDRLRMRPHRLDDFADCAAMWADAVVTRFVGGKPLTEEESWARLLRYAGHWSLMGFGYWAVHQKATGSFIGEVGFSELRREIDPPFDGVPELGWVFASRAHGQGFATEAVRAAITWGDSRLASHRMVCMIDRANAASIRVAEKCGFHEYARTTYKSAPVILLSRERELI